MSLCDEDLNCFVNARLVVVSLHIKVNFYIVCNKYIQCNVMLDVQFYIYETLLL